MFKKRPLTLLLHPFYTDVQEYVDNVVHNLTKGAAAQNPSVSAQKKSPLSPEKDNGLCLIYTGKSSLHAKK